MGWKVEINECLFEGLQALEKDAEEVLRRSLYDGAKVVADKVKQGIEGLPTEPSRWLRDGEQYSGITEGQKSDLTAALGVSVHRQTSTGWDTVIGFDGYGSRPTKKYPKGLPNQLLARAIESGSSVRRKNPFIRRAVNSCRKDAIEAMKKTFDEEVEKRVK